MQIAHLAWRVDAIDEWRRLHVDPALAQHGDGLAALVNADQLAAAVATALKGRGGLELTVLQKVAAFVVGVVLLADGLKGLVS